MQLSHAATGLDVAFDDPNLIADAGLVPVIALAEQVGLPGLVAEHVTITGAVNSAGANPGAKVMSLVAGMVAGADSIEDVDRLRHAGNAVVFDEIRAPSTLGTFLRAFTHGHVQQLNAVLCQTLIRLTEQVPLLPGADEVVFVDLDSTHRQVYGYAKQGGAVGRLKGSDRGRRFPASPSSEPCGPLVVAHGSSSPRGRAGSCWTVPGRAPRLVSAGAVGVEEAVCRPAAVVFGDGLVGHRLADGRVPGLPLGEGVGYVVGEQQRFPAQRAEPVLGA
jgi:hypothetical protein